jgi:hypothetical protein
MGAQWVVFESRFFFNKYCLEGIIVNLNPGPERDISNLIL